MKPAIPPWKLPVHYSYQNKTIGPTTSEKPNSKPSLNIISDKDSSLDFASLLLPALKPTNEKYTFTKSNVTIPRLTSSELGLYVSYDPDKAIYTDASHSAFIDKDGSNGIKLSKAVSPS